MILLLIACSAPETVETPIAGQLAPLEDVNLAPEIPVDGDDLAPEGILFASGEREDGLYWAHAKANVHVALPTVWGCLQDVDTVVDRREVDEWTSEPSAEPGFDHAVVIHNTVHDIITIDYDLLWLHERQGGSEDSPTDVIAVWQKTEGANVISLLQGSAVLTAEGDDVTRIELIEHLDATLRDEETIISYLTDLYDSVAACAHGRTLPEY